MYFFNSEISFSEISGRKSELRGYCVNDISIPASDSIKSITACLPMCFSSNLHIRISCRARKKIRARVDARGPSAEGYTENGSPDGNAISDDVVI